MTNTQTSGASGRQVAQRPGLRRVAYWLLLSAVAFTVYALSLGPVVHHYRRHESLGWEDLPPLVRFLYTPLHAVGEYLPVAYDHYIVWWMSD